MSPEDAYSILEAIAEIHGCTDKLLIIKPNEEEVLAEEIAQEIDTGITERASNFSFTKCKSWWSLEVELVEKVAALLNCVCEKPYINLVTPFMERNGYRDGRGWWVKKEETSKNA